MVDSMNMYAILNELHLINILWNIWKFYETKCDAEGIINVFQNPLRIHCLTLQEIR